MATIREKLTADMQAAQSVVDQLVAETESKMTAAKAEVETIAAKIAAVPEAWLEKELETVKDFINSL